MGGSDVGPDPYEHLLAALGTCTSMTLRMYAQRSKIPLDHGKVELQHSREHGKDCENCDSKGHAIDVITRQISLDGELSEAQRQRLLEIADKCPVHKTLHGELQIRSSLKIP